MARPGGESADRRTGRRGDVVRSRASSRPAGTAGEGRQRNRQVGASVDLASWRRRLGEPTDTAALYATFAAAGLEYGPAFRGILELRRQGTEALARIALAEQAGSAAAYQIHPTVLDACFQVMEGLLADGSDETWLPIRIDSLRVLGSVTGPLWCRAQIEAGDASHPDRRRADLAVFDESGACG